MARPDAKQYGKQDQQGKVVFNEHNSHTTQQQGPVTRSPGRPQTKPGQGTSQVFQSEILEESHCTPKFTLAAALFKYSTLCICWALGYTNNV
jgi:hypothetical protein